MRRLRAPRTPRQRYQYWAITFASLVVALAIAALLFSLGRVKIVVTATSVPVRADFDLTVISTGAPQERELMGRFFVVDGAASVDHSVAVLRDGVPLSELPPAKARGTVTLVNTHSVAQPLVATTRLRTEGGVLFRLDRAVVVPARGKLESAAVTADVPGVHANIGPSKFVIPGLSPWLQERIWAESSETMRGGQGRSDSTTAAPPSQQIVQQKDIDAARSAASAKAARDLEDRANARASSAEDVFLLERTEAIEVDGAVGDARPTIRATATVHAQALILPRGTLRERARAALEEAAVVQGREFRRLDERSLDVRLAAQEPATGRVTIAVHAEGDARLAPTFSSFDARRLTGFSAADVQTYLRSIPGVENVEVTLWPSWLRTVPASGGVEVEVHETLGVQE